MKIATRARTEPKLELTTLAQHLDAAWLREAYRRTRKDGAVEVDGVVDGGALRTGPGGEPGSL